MSQGTEEAILSFGDLEKGVLYPIKEAIKEVRKFPNNKNVDSVKLDISSSEFIKTCTYVPSGILSYAMENVQVINKAAKEQKCYAVCFYGVVEGTENKKRFFGRIHTHEDGVNQELLKEVARLNAMVVKKRPSDSPVVEDTASLRKRNSSDLGEEASTSGSPAKLAKED